VFGWWAQIFQHPDDKQETSLVLKGKEGTGKTIVGLVFGSILGPHYQIVAEPRYVTGRFNSHMAQLLLLHADEAFWAGDKKTGGKVKDMVTGKRHPIEFKGFEVIFVDNYMRLFVSSNENWVVPADMDARRFCVLEVGADHKEDHSYFAAITEEMNKGGREALLAELLAFDLSKVNLRKVPRTKALLDQKMESFTSEQAWWFDVLQRGELPQLMNDCECHKHTLHDSYIRRVGDVSSRSERSTQTKLGMFLSKMVGPGLDGTIRDANKNKKYVWHFPSLKNCREHFVKLTQGEIAWDDPDAKWEDDKM
jgi:Family of unknown function (DUF5906)